jgi:gliding motility-associated-like protein
MYLKALSVIALCVFSVLFSFAQPCTTPGQNPATAFPVCGVDTFSQTIVPNCGGTRVPVPCQDGITYTDIRPFWYKFTCFTGGTLGFLITPNDMADDYDWQIFDITGKNPNDVYTDATMFVACNWSGNTGLTGTSAAGNNLTNCAGTSYPTFSKMPTLIQGHEYLILLSNFSPSQKGYKLSFDGGTASITDPQSPKLRSAISGCAGIKVGIKLNKKMKCATLAANGSDFSLSPANATIIGAEGVGCNGSFDMDSVILTMSGPLTPGNYTLTIRNGSDGNTIKDNCDRDIPVGDNLQFAVLPVAPTPMDSLTKVGCMPDLLQLVFKKPIDCASIAADGSDFTVTGPAGVTITSAAGNCVGNKTTVIQVRLSGPIQTGGNYQIRLQRGTDGNTLLDDCMLETPIGSSINFTVADTVNADFNYQLLMGCRADTLILSHDGQHGVNSWTWWSNNAVVSAQQNHTIIYTVFGMKQIKLRVSNGVCSDSTTVAINLDNEIKADFSVADVLCPEDMATFTDKSIGQLVSYAWEFGNGSTSSVKNPPAQKYNAPTSTREMFYTARLIVTNNNNCSDTLTKRIKAVNTCIIAVPNAFTPNNDGRNDFLYPLNAYKADNLIFRVYNRFGQVIFESKDWTKRWDGTINGHAQPTGTYVWVLQYIDRDTQQKVLKRGTTLIIR